MQKNINKISPDARIGKNVKLGRGVSIAPGAIIYDNVQIGDDSFIGPKAVIGEPLQAFYEEEGYKNPVTVIGKNTIVRAGTIIYADSHLGDFLQTGHYAVIREKTKMGMHCSVGTFCQIDGYISIGDFCRFHYNSHLSQKSRIGSYVWFYHYAVTSNDPHPPCGLCMEGPTINDFAVIATHAVLLPKVHIGKNSLVGANSVVSKDVPDNMIAAGNPARIIGPVTSIRCESGKLGKRPYPWQDHYSRGYPWEKK